MWKRQGRWILAVMSLVLIPSLMAWVYSQEKPPNSPPRTGVKSRPTPAQGMTADDAVAQAQQPQSVPLERPEQHLTVHDQSAVFQATQAQPVSPALANQPDDGKIIGFDFYRDPLDAKKPMQTLSAIMAEESAAKPNVMTVQRELLERRYNLQPKLDPEAKMSRGKPLAVGPTARLPAGITWERLSAMAPEDIRQANLFPYPSLPHPLQRNGGQVFPPVQTAMFPRLERFDVEFDIPDAFLPEFPPAIYLQNRPELGDVSRGQVVSLNNFRELFKDLLTPIQLEGLRLLLTPLPQEEFNLTPPMTARPKSRAWAWPAWIATSMATPPASFT